MIFSFTDFLSIKFIFTWFAKVDDIVSLSELTNFYLHSYILLKFSYFDSVKLSKVSIEPTVLFFGKFEDLALLDPLISASHFPLVSITWMGVLPRLVAAQRLSINELLIANRAYMILFGGISLIDWFFRLYFCRYLLFEDVILKFLHYLWSYGII